MKRIGVTGAFGFLGANFVAALLEERGRGSSREGLEIVAFASKTRSNPLFDADEVEVRELDVLDRDDLARNFSGLDAIAHFAGRVDYRPRAKRAVWDVNVLGSKRVFEAALAVGSSRLLYVSSICALGSPGPAAGLSDEGSRPYGDPRWPTSFASRAEALDAVEASDRGDYGFLARVKAAYFDSKLAAWELAKDYRERRSLPVVTIFPGTAVGRGDIHRSISKLVDSVWEGRLPFSFQGATNFMDVRDLAKGALLALDKGRIGEGYILGGRDEHNYSYVDFQRLVARLAKDARGAMADPALGRDGGLPAVAGPLVLPFGLLMALAAAAERVAPGGSLSRAFVLAGSLRNVCSSAKARSELGYEPSESIEAAILEARSLTRRP